VNTDQPLRDDLWAELASRAEITLSEAQHSRLNQYLDRLLEANQTMNLTAITDRVKAQVLHVGDALTLLPFLPAGKISIADIGSGGGAPAIPLAIARPDASITCIEATGKKAAFLQSAAAALELNNLHVVNQRAEEVGRSARRQSFDLAVARAVGTMIWVAEFALPLVRTGGKVLAMKGIKARQELLEAKGAIAKLGGGQTSVHAISLPDTDGHVIVEIPKTRPTPAIFPRLPSQAKGKPIRT
jgi:16S rRNA (guanine527-N7)-methyltransferase